MMPDTTALPNSVAQFHLRDRLMRVRWEQRRPVLTLNGWSIYVDPGDMAPWLAWVRRGQQMVAVGNETWLILSGFGPALQRFIDDITDWPKDGLIYLPIDGFYRDAALHYSKVTGNDVVRAKDAIKELEERSERLLNYASDLAEHPDNRTLSQTVISELVEVGDDLAILEQRMERLKTMIYLARTHAETAAVR